MTAFIELTGLSVSLAGRTILKDLNGSFSGRCIGLLGPNGAVNATLLQTLLGCYSPTHGTARARRLESQAQVRQIRHERGYMPKNYEFRGPGPGYPVRARVLS